MKLNSHGLENKRNLGIILGRPKNRTCQFLRVYTRIKHSAKLVHGELATEEQPRLATFT